MRKSLIAITAALAFSPLVAHAQQYPHHGYRSPWYIGFGIGSGGGSIYYPGGVTYSFRDEVTSYQNIFSASDNGHLAFNFKVGATITPQFLLGFDLTTLRAFGSVTDLNGVGYSSYAQVWNFDLMSTFFPFERGLFFRAGMGPSIISSGISGPFGSTRNYDQGGFNGTLGVGYAFWLARRFNLTLNADYSHQWYSASPGGPDTSGVFVFLVGFDWY